MKRPRPFQTSALIAAIVAAQDEMNTLADKATTDRSAGTVDAAPRVSRPGAAQTPKGVTP